MNRVKQKLQTFALNLAIRYRDLNRSEQLALVWCVPLMAALLAYALIFMDRPVAFAYAKSNCYGQITVLPRLLSSSTSNEYQVSAANTFRIYGYPVFGRAVCVEALKTPTPGRKHVVLSPFGSGVFAKKFVITADEYATPIVAKLATTPVPVQKPLDIPLSAPDTLFNYFLRVGDAAVICTGVNAGLTCNLPALKLSQGAPYEAVLLRSFGNEKQTVAARLQFTTLSATTISDASVRSGEIIYGRPTSFSFTADKELRAAEFRVQKITGADRVDVPATTKIDGRRITVNLQSELPREASFEISAQTLEAVDGSGLSDGYRLTFTTSGGPRPVSANIGRHGVSQSATVIVTFDQAIVGLSNVAGVASVAGVSAAVSQSGNRMLFNLQNAPLCAEFKVVVQGELTSPAGVKSAVNWSYTSRTRCYTVATIGYSARGRAIQAYSFGSGPAAILYIGSIHGNERSAGLLMDWWIDELDANPGKIPAGRRIVVIPRVNPDGYAANQRVNANNIDLNRNFATSDWKSDITVPGGSLLAGGGGMAPMSEPETQVLANYTQQLNPRLVMSYHAVASVVIANGAGISVSAAVTYSQSSGYQKTAGSSDASIFQYDTCGAYEDWLAEKNGIAAVTVELGSYTYAQSDRNRAGLWAMAGM